MRVLKGRQAATGASQQLLLWLLLFAAARHQVAVVVCSAFGALIVVAYVFSVILSLIFNDRLPIALPLIDRQNVSNEH